VPLTPPPRVSSNPLRAIARDLRHERAATVPYPPGDTRFSLARTMRFTRTPLPILLDAYERYGPVFTLRILHEPSVFMLGPAANHYMTVSHAQNFSWREGHMGDLMPLLGDGLLTIDGEFHRRSRKIMLPAFHRERIEAAETIMRAETNRALDRIEPGEAFDLYAFTRDLALRIAMRALFGLDPDRARAGGLNAAHEFEEALGFWSRDYVMQMLRGPGTPWRRMRRARQRLDALLNAEVARRRKDADPGDDVLSLLVEARDEDGAQLSQRHIRDEVMTLMFAGHDTTTSTVAFLFYELARAPRLADDPSFDLGPAIDETLRLYPPAWIGPRRSIEPFTFNDLPVPGGAAVNYCSWASHRLPDVWDEPNAFRPQRFSPANRERIPKGAYVPFGGGSRMCIGMRFGLAEVAVIAAAILDRFRLDLVPGYQLQTRQMPTIGPKDGMPVIPRMTTAGGPVARPALAA
jgi:cytochrome P450